MYASFGGTYFIATPYLLAQMGWTQANASLALFSQSFATIAGYGLNYWAVGSVRGESYSMFGIGLGCAAAGNLIVGLLSPAHVAGFWVGFLIIGVAYGFALPALPTIASQHAAPEEQAQLQSAFTVASMIGLIVASQLHTNIFDVNAVGVVAGVPFYTSTVLLVVALVIHVLVRVTHDTGTGAGWPAQYLYAPLHFVLCFVSRPLLWLELSRHVDLSAGVCVCVRACRVWVHGYACVAQAYHCCRHKTSVSNRTTRRLPAKYRVTTRAAAEDASADAASSHSAGEEDTGHDARDHHERR